MRGVEVTFKSRESTLKTHFRASSQLWGPRALLLRILGRVAFGMRANQNRVQSQQICMGLIRAMESNPLNTIPMLFCLTLLVSSIVSSGMVEIYHFRYH